VAPPRRQERRAAGAARACHQLLLGAQLQGHGGTSLHGCCGPGHGRRREGKEAGWVG
jgi:hypothetical protein